MSGAVATGGWLGDVRSPRSLVVWAGLLVPPLAWGAHLVIADLLFELGCAQGVEGERLAGLSLAGWSLFVTAAAAAATATAGAAAGAAWRRLRRASDGVALGRARALAAMGATHSLLYLALILFGLVPPLVLEPCARLL